MGINEKINTELHWKEVTLINIALRRWVEDAEQIKNFSKDELEIARKVEARLNRELYDYKPLK